MIETSVIQITFDNGQKVTINKKEALRLLKELKKALGDEG